jgi:hypothetical protein
VVTSLNELTIQPKPAQPSRPIPPRPQASPIASDAPRNKIARAAAIQGDWTRVAVIASRGRSKDRRHSGRRTDPRTARRYQKPLDKAQSRWRAFYDPLALIFAVKRLGAVERPFGGKPPVRDAVAAQSWEWSERRRLIRLLSAGWLPSSVSSSRGFPLSRGRASGGSPAT